MCHEATATNATPDDVIFPFARPVDTLLPDRDPPRRSASFSAMLDALTETRSAIGLVLLAASAHRTHPNSSLGAVLEIAAQHFLATAEALRAHAAAGEA